MDTFHALLPPYFGLPKLTALLILAERYIQLKSYTNPKHAALHLKRNKRHPKPKTQQIPRIPTIYARTSTNYKALDA